MNYFATRADPAHRREWMELMSPRKVGLIMKSLRTEFKFVSWAVGLSVLPSPSWC